MEVSNEKMRASVEWMSEKYEELNRWLFNGELGPCHFNIFTTGRGSQGDVLGWFKINGDNIYINTSSRKMYQNSYFTQHTYINYNNFYEICKPTIELNGHYTGTENALLSTLAHEMCHYYTYMYGICPRQGHGKEFKNIAQIISSRSNGLFTIQRLASAEEMEQYELDDEMKERKNTRINNKKSRMYALLVFTKNGKIELSLSTNKELIYDIVNYLKTSGLYKRKLKKDEISKIIVSNDANLIEMFFERGYRKSFRTYRFWSIDTNKLGGENFVENGGYSYKVEYSDENDKKLDDNNEEVNNRQKKYVFTIKTSNGNVEIEYNGSQEVLRNKLKERFPKMSDEAIDKIMSNKANYRIMENKKDVDINMIVEKVIRDFMDTKIKDDENSIKINPNMNLGLSSPLETEE